MIERRYDVVEPGDQLCTSCGIETVIALREAERFYADRHVTVTTLGVDQLTTFDTDTRRGVMTL